MSSGNVTTTGTAAQTTSPWVRSRMSNVMHAVNWKGTILTGTPLQNPSVASVASNSQKAPGHGNSVGRGEGVGVGKAVGNTGGVGGNVGSGNGGVGGVLLHLTVSL
jgi:hypothetical protein